MGIGRLVLTGAREVITSGDDALDKGKPGFAAAWSEYDRTLDRSVLSDYLHPRREPAVFVIAPLTLAQQKAIEDHTRWSERLFETLAYGVREIRGVEVINERGEPVALAPVAGRLPDQALELFKDDRLRSELFARVRQVTGLSPEVAKSDSA